MKICGIIVEYNPLHNGHLYHIEEAKRKSQCDVLVAIMSGNFVQRGEPSLLSKEIRTKLALKAGCDVVIELPYLYATSHADLFSFGAISILNHCGVNEIVFGSETQDENLLKEIALMLDNPTFSYELKQLLDIGYSYPEASHKALQKMTNQNIELLSNDLLGIQYIRSILHINKNITFKTIKRIHTNYKDVHITHEKIASATSIRKNILNSKSIGDTVPAYTKKALENNSLHIWNDYFPYLKYEILSQRQALKDIHDMYEGLENALIENITKHKTYDSFVQSLISKRFTRGKIQRTLTHVLNHITKEDAKFIKEGPQYIRLLGFHHSKSNMIKLMEKSSQIPFITNINKKNYDLVKLDLQVSDIYHLTDEKKERKIPYIYHENE